MGNTVKIKKFSLRALLYIVLVLWAFILFIPFAWMLLGSFKTTEEITEMGSIFPSQFNFDNYVDVFYRINFMQMIMNTAIITICGTIVQVAGSIVVAYGFARFQYKYKNVFFMVLLATTMLPWVVTMVPSYVIYAKIGWVNTYLPFIIPSMGGNALYIFMTRQFIMGIPKDLDEAATIDGCNSFRILLQILVPLMLPVIATITIFCFVNYWSDFIGPSIYLRTQTKFTISQGLQMMKKSMTERTPWNAIMAGSVMFSIPMIIVFFSAQKAFVEGVVTTGLKV